MTTKDAPLCVAYDQISDRKCRYYADHGGKHNFARLDHDCTLERELRCALDEITRGLAEALDLFDAVWCPEHGHAPKPEQLERAAKLRKLVNLDHGSSRDLRRVLDEMTAARDELASIAEGEALDETYSPSEVKRTLARIAELREVGAS